MNYTRGEWVITEERYSHNIGLYRLIQTAEGELIAHVWPGSNPLTDGNAHLIAAAPNVYEALKEADILICELCVRLNPQHENCTSCDERTERLKAIAKAEGR